MNEFNYYGLPIIPPEQFNKQHEPVVPTAGGLPPWCTCGWTRKQAPDGTWIELSDHLRDMETKTPLLDKPR